jgi:NADH-quinone oxidoreductase subunit K
VVTADTLDEASGLVRAAICPHRLSVLVPPKKSLAYLSSLDLGACGLASLQYGFDVDIDAGQMMVIFVMAVAAAEVAVGLGILISIFRSRENINVDEINVMRG